MVAPTSVAEAPKNPCQRRAVHKGSRVRIAGRRLAGTFATHHTRPAPFVRARLALTPQSIVDFAPKVTDCFRSSCVGKREARSHRRRSPDRPPSDSHPRKTGGSAPGLNLAQVLPTSSNALATIFCPMSGGGDFASLQRSRWRACARLRWRSRLTHPPAAAQSSCGRHRKSGRCRSAPHPPRAGPALPAADAG